MPCVVQFCRVCGCSAGDDLCCLVFKCSVTWFTGVLLSLPDGMEQLRDGISSLCETLWCREFAARDELVPQMLAYLLQRCLNPSSSVIVAVH